MKPRLIKQVNGEPGILLEPTNPDGEFIGAVVIHTPEQALLINIAKKRILLRNTPAELMDLFSNNVHTALDHFVEEVQDSESGFKIKNGAEGVIMDRYDESGALNGFVLQQNTFREVVQY